MTSLLELLETSHPVLPGLLLALLAGLMLIFVWSPVAQLIAHWRLHSLVNKLGRAALRHQYVPDGLDDVIYVEQLLLRQDRLLLITIKPFRGNIFAAEQIDQWTQVIGHHSYKFPNPLHQLQSDLQALRGVIRNIQIDGMVVFAKGSQFPKGKPSNVLAYQDLKTYAPDSTDEVKPHLQEAWNSLLASAKPAKEMQQSILFRKGDKRRLFIGCLLAVATVFYALWYLGIVEMS